VKTKRIKHNGGIAGLIKRTKELDTAILVGVLKSAGNYSGSGNPHVAQVAKWNAEGTPTIPKRHFLQKFLKDGREKYKKAMGALYRNRLRGRVDRGKAYRNIGALTVKDMKRIILDWRIPKNAASTVKKKGFDDPLIHTKRLVNSIDWRME